MAKEKTESSSQAPARTDERCPSGIEGLDEILTGGLPRDCFYLIQGDPGSGKTTLALQFLLEGLRRGERALYITLSETKEELERVARSHGWSLQGIPLIELSRIESLLRPETQTTVFHPSEMELNKIGQMLTEEARKAKPARVVFDSLSEFRLIAETSLRYRRELLRLKQEFTSYNSTVLLLDDKMDANVGGDPHVLSLTHGVIEMEQLSPDYGASRRRLRVVKMRGVKFHEGYHDYAITKGGLRIFPRLVAAQHHADFVHKPVSSGIKEMDELFGGGLDRGTTTLIIGQAGTGKSTIALQYAVQMAAQGEKSMIFAFDETRAVMLTRAHNLGLDLAKHVNTGNVTVQQVDPAELSPGEFAIRILQGVAKGVKLVVIDSLSGYLNSMPGEKYLNSQMHELCASLNQQGVVTILIVPQHGMVHAVEAPVDISYLADTVVSVRFFEALGEVRQALAVIKKRSGHHERTIREFKMERGKGIRVGSVIRDFQGVLTGVPVFHGEKDQILNVSDAPK
jgi:circadian clock protein KaiC